MCRNKKHSRYYGGSYQLLNVNSYSTLVLLFLVSVLHCQSAIDTITPTKFIRDPEALVSSGSIFKLGFFSPPGTRNRYVGIWYNEISVSTVIWVVNRDMPLNDSSGIVTISAEGNLLVLNGQSEILWSSNVSNSETNATAHLLDSGNLVLQEVSSNRIIWESFQHPCDSFLPTMKLGTNLETGEKQMLTSWKSPSDPSIGSFSAGVDPLNLPEIFIWKGSLPYWRGGPWNGQIFLGVDTTRPAADRNEREAALVNVVNDREGSAYVTYTISDQSFLFRVFLSSQGTLAHAYWDDGKNNWVNLDLAPTTQCATYGKCGAFGICNPQEPSICSCLRGFEPKNEEEWRGKNWTSGCVRRTKMQCESGGEGKEDGFLKLKTVKAPDFAEWSSARQCKSKCLQNCSCVAYAYDAGIGCMSWTGDLVDIQKFSSGGVELYIRVAYSELDKERNYKAIITISVIIGTITIVICIFSSWMCIAKRREKIEQSKKVVLAKFQELPLFEFEKLASATKKFHITNKLGEGGFGPVYRGTLQDGQKIAVKRLSRTSGQGLEEFMNEVVVIAKLQHRNLVRLLGCCVEREENMLVYEYMPNKSLDTFLFDPLKQKTLHWRQRLVIIEGIGRGLLYLHRDSRLRIIHRDLKPSNILLDEELIPKISDFGMARIVGNKQDQDKTKRVVGTYGYMPPEYAMQGMFSEKSDVFSFGVLLLEIISGRRNTSFYYDEQSLSLLGFAWKLWEENNIIGLMDPLISDDPCLRLEILRCIHVGLLCVQEFAKDRPTVSTILSMLGSEIVDLPTPKQPAFTESPIRSDTQKIPSINNASVTIMEGR